MGSLRTKLVMTSFLTCCCVCLYRDSNIRNDSVFLDPPRNVADESDFYFVRQLFRGALTAVNHCLLADWLDMEYSLGLRICRAFR